MEDEEMPERIKAFQFIDAMEALMNTNLPAVEMRKAIIELVKKEE